MRPPGRAHLDDADALQGSGGPRDAAGEVEVEDEVLPEALLRRQAVGGDDLAQRRQAVGGAGAHAASRVRSAVREAGGEPQRLDQAGGIGEPLAGDVEGGAVVGRGAHEGQAQRHVDRAVEGQRLDRDQRLVMGHGDADVVAGAGGGVEQRVGRVRAGDGETLVAQPQQRGGDDLDLLAADVAALAGRGG